MDRRFLQAAIAVPKDLLVVSPDDDCFVAVLRCGRFAAFNIAVREIFRSLRL
jgi:hypothetical protein